MGTGENLGFCRVLFDDINLVSYWLQLPSTATKTAKFWTPIEINSQVACLMDNHFEQGIIVGVMWSDKDTPPDWGKETTVGMQFQDGAKLYYNFENHKLIVDMPNSEIIINNGNNTTAKADILKTELKKMSARIDGIIDAISNAVPVPQDGGTGLQATMVVALQTLVNKEDFTNIENPKIKH